MDEETRNQINAYTKGRRSGLIAGVILTVGIVLISKGRNLARAANSDNTTTDS